MMQELSISVAMCTYNGSRYLGSQLESIVSQKRQPDELVVCDDRSTDDTAAILHKFSQAAPFPVKVFINGENLGYTKNFEKVIGLCEGDIIVLSDQDDIWHPDKLRLMEVVFSSRPDVGGVFSNAELVDENLIPLDHTLWDVIQFTDREQGLVREGRLIDVLMRHPIVTGGTFGFRSTHRNHIVPIPARWVHDGWIALIVATTSPLEIIQENLIQYRQHPGSQIGAQKKGPLRRLSESLKIDRANYYGEEIIRYEDALRRMRKFLDEKHPAISRVEMKLDHLRRRSQLPKNRLLRIPRILKGVLTMRYHRYSQGWPVAVRDMIIP